MHSQLGDYYDDVDALFSSNTLEMIVYSKKDAFYWTLGIGSKNELKYMDSLTDAEIIESFRSKLPMPVSSGSDTGEYTKADLFKTDNYRFNTKCRRGVSLC